MIKDKISSPVFFFGTLTLLVVFSQILLLRPIIGQGLTNEDYGGLYAVRVFKDTIFSNPVNYWMRVGLHNATHDFYIAFLDLLFGENYNMYLYTSIFIKIIATLLLYPLIVLVTKNKLLAFLTTFLYGISYPSAGALYLYVVSNEYLGVALMNLFLIIYYFCVKKTNFWLLLLSSISITLSFLAAPIRIFPVFAIILLIELVILVKSKFSKPFYSILRLASVFLPIMVITKFSLGNTGTGAYSLAGLPDFLKKVSDGNWYLLLNPLWGFGYTFLPIRYMVYIFGGLDTNKFGFLTYLGFLLQKPMIIFTLFSLVLCDVLSKQKLRFFFYLMSINLILDILLYVIFSHHLSIPRNLVREGGFDSFHGLYTNILTNYVISISITCIIEWYLIGKKKRLLFLIFISPFISLSFIVGQWIFTRDYLTFQEGIHRYFVIPAIGSYLFIATIIVMIYQSKKIKSGFYPYMLLILLIILAVVNVGKDEIFKIFTGKKVAGRDLQIQESMKAQILSYIPKNRIKENLLIYIKFKSEKLGDSNHWEDTFDWQSLTMWLPIKISHLTNKGIDGCVVVTWDVNELRRMAKMQNGVKGFLYNDNSSIGKQGLCARHTGQYSVGGKFLSLDNLYAFAIDQTKVIDITEKVRKDFK